MTKRAEQVDQTRLRIVEATVELHGTVGPAATSIAAIAERAGVTRLTVYRHFADDEALFAACSAHWTAQQQAPDPDAWALLDDPRERLEAGLLDLYRFYRDGAQMLSHVHRDWSALPTKIRRGLEAQERRYEDVLLAPLGEEGETPQLRALVGHAASFWTWRSLCLERSLAHADAVDALCALILAEWRRTTSAPAPSPRRGAARAG